MMLYHIIKRIIDVVVSLIGVVILIPLFIVLAIWIKLTSKGPVIFKQKRLGKDRKPFIIYKFRSMIIGASDLQKKGVPDKELITSSGRFMRKTFFDETAQLFNVLKGDMSLIGPRPTGRLVRKEWKEVAKIKPGITGLESVADYLPQKDRIKFEEHFKNLLKKDISKDFSKHILLLDSYYVKNESFWLDLKIMFYTILLAVRRIFSN